MRYAPNQLENTAEGDQRVTLELQNTWGHHELVKSPQEGEAREELSATSFELTRVDAHLCLVFNAYIVFVGILETGNL